MSKRNRTRAAINLQDGEHILAAWAESASGPGWANQPLWVLVIDGDKRPRVECIQPGDQTQQMALLYSLSQAAHLAMTNVVRGATARKTISKGDRMTDYNALHCEASAYARANAAEARVKELEAEIEMQRRDQTEFTGAALCALGLNRDECVSPGNQVLDEINRLTTKVSELTRLLGEADGAIREAADETSGEPEFSDERCSYETIQVSYGWRKEWRESAPVQRALKGASS